MSSRYKDTNFNNTRQARSVMREIYGRYALGKDRYPSARIQTSAEALPERIRPVAKLITRAWHVIDMDEAYFVDMVHRGAKSIAKSGKEDTAGLVVAKSGRNAVNLGMVSIRKGQPHTVVGTFTPEEAIDLVNNHTNRAPNVAAVRFDESGQLEVPPHPDAIILRPRQDGAALVFGDPSMLDGLASLRIV